MTWFNHLSKKRWLWSSIALSALSLFVLSLVFQHIFGYQPCVMCIYQRTAVLGIAITSVVPLCSKNAVFRVFAIVSAIYIALKGLQAAWSHKSIIQVAETLGAVCSTRPNFPSTLLLDEWLPAVFAATGKCNEDSWQFLQLGMSTWMQIIFVLYLGALGVLLISQFFGSVNDSQSR